MNCEEFQQSLQAAIEERADICMSATVLDHAQVCERTACQQAWAEYELLTAIVPVWQASLPESCLVEGVLSRLRKTTDLQGEALCSGPIAQSTGQSTSETAPRRDSVIQRHQQERQSTIRSLMAVLCAVACLMLLVPLLRLSGNSAIDVTRVIPQDAPADDIMLATQTTPQLITVHSYAGVPQSATEFVTDAMVLFVPADFSDPEDEGPSRPEQWRGRLGEQLEPISREFGTAVDAFLQVVSQPPPHST